MPNWKVKKKKSDIIKEELEFLQAGVSNPSIWKSREI